MLVFKHMPFESDHAPWRYTRADGSFIDAYSDSDYIKRSKGGGKLVPYNHPVPHFEIPKDLIGNYKVYKWIPDHDDIDRYDDMMNQYKDWD